MSTPPPVIIRVKDGNEYAASVVKGPKARASSTMSRECAAVRCAAKSLGCSESRVCLVETSHLNGVTLYEATLREQPDLFEKGGK